MSSRRLRAILEYDGADYSGWQRLKSLRSVQGVLEQAMLDVTRQPTTVVGAGRTDAGVHAIGQVAHFDTAWQREPAALQRALNAVLPRDVAVRALEPATPAFHARHSAISRVYRYTLLVDSVRSPLMRRRSWHLVGPLDVESMQAAAAELEGEHDFASLGQPMTRGGPTVRHVQRMEVMPAATGLSVEVVVEANAFLRHQVRRTVGLLADVGKGRISIDAVGRLMSGEAVEVKARRAPAQGLVLEKVTYPAELAVD